MGRQHQGMDRSGVCQVPKSSGGQGKMEKTGCKIICGAPTTLTVKGLMMVMMMKLNLEVGNDSRRERRWLPGSSHPLKPNRHTSRKKERKNSNQQTEFCNHSTTALPPSNKEQTALLPIPDSSDASQNQHENGF